MTNGPREELRALLFDSAPPVPVDGDAMFARTLASGDGAGADLLPPDGLYDLPDDDPADDGLDAGSAGGDDLGSDLGSDVGSNDLGDDDLGDGGGEPADGGGGEDVTWDDDPADPADPLDPGDHPFDPATGW